jgi:L,D-peptidoglycan transpeptidase YkuD (ErfK/YbiS/YcfS/YnhG family)
MVYSAGRLRHRGQYITATCGRTGITDRKREGDGATPRGVHSIVGLFYRPDRVAAPSDWAQPIYPGDLWCDDPEHLAYNHLCRAPLHASHEHMWRSDPQYDVVLITDWNWPVASPGRGSAIFIHQWRRPGAPTAGCIAMARRDLNWLVARVKPGSRLIIR